MDEPVMNQHWTEGSVDADGVDIHYVRTGDGTMPPVVLIHGFTDNGRCWTRVARALEPAADLVMVDARNHGASATAVGSSADMADDVAAVVVKLGLGPLAVVGHSLGANTAAELAVRHPTLVKQLVLEDPPWRQSAGLKTNGSEGAGVADPGDIVASRRAGLRAFIESFTGLSSDEIIAAGRGQHPLWHEAEFADWAMAKTQVRAEAIESITSHPWPELVPRLLCPTLLVHGEVELGGIVGPALAADVAALNELVCVGAVEGAGHNIRREAFESYMDVVRSFLFEV